MNDKEVWENSFKNKDSVKGFEVKPGPALTEEQIKERKEKLQKEKEDKLIESLQDQIYNLEKELDKVKKVYKNLINVKSKPQVVVENNESKVTEKEIK